VAPITMRQSTCHPQACATPGRKAIIAVRLLFFHGHSTLVALACGDDPLRSSCGPGHVHFGAPAHDGVGLISTGILCSFLFTIPLVNNFDTSLQYIWRAFVGSNRRGCRCPFGPLNHILRPLHGLITNSKAMYPLVFCLGLGDTASEVGLVGSPPAKRAMRYRYRPSCFPHFFTAAGLSI